MAASRPAARLDTSPRGAANVLQVIRAQQAVPVAAADDGAAHTLYLDVETRSVVSLRDVGADRYVRDPSSKILCVGFALDDNEPQIWTPGHPVPWQFDAAAKGVNWSLCAHNAGFEIAVLEHLLKPFGFPEIPLARWRCTMAQALACGLQAKLERLADALECACRKDLSGARLMHMMARQRRARKGEDSSIPVFFDDADRLARLYAYCLEDVRVLREVASRLPQLSAAEQHVWQLTHTINQRGFYIDKQLAQAAQSIAEAARPEIDAELRQLTGGIGANQVGKLLQWVQQQGVKLRKLDKKSIEKQLLDDELPGNVRHALELRLSSAQSASRKIDALLLRAGEDCRVRGSFMYHGASTGRWAGSGPQPQNLKRPQTEDIEGAIAAINSGDYEKVRKAHARPLSLIGDITRSLICAPPGYQLIGADFSSIESRVLAWVAGEEWKLDSYRRFDATHDPRDEPYCITACKLFNKPNGTFTKDDPERAVGKVADLALGYSGGIAAWRKWDDPDRFSDDEVKGFIHAWRSAHANIKKFWYRLDKAAWTAVQQRGVVARCGAVRFICNGTFLQLTLPSGRKITYPQPRIIGDEHEQHVLFSDNTAGQFTDCKHGRGAYGGLWAENVVSGIARDLLADAMLRIEAAGYPIVLHVHDEAVAEVPEGFGSPVEFTHLMTRQPAWALQLPIAAKAWTGKRYTK
jgi:DNA polymerase